MPGKPQFFSYNKFHVKKKWCKQSGTKCERIHDSSMEAERCNILFIAERAGILQYESQVKYPIIVNGLHICFHILDFRILRDGKLVVEDVKGTCTPDWKLKYKLFLAQYPEIPYIVNHGGNFGKGSNPVVRPTKAKDAPLPPIFQENLLL